MFFWSSGTAASKHAEINRDRKKSYLENEKYSLGSSKVSFKDIFMNDQTGSKFTIFWSRMQKYNHNTG